MNRIVVVLSAFLLAGTALAGTSTSKIAQAEGTVLVNQGKQFVTAQPNQVLAVGDRIMVMEGGKATIQYADGCVQSIGSGSMVLMSEKSSCAAGLVATPVSANTAQAVGDDDDDNNMGIWIVGGLAAAGAAYLISDGDDATISP